VREPCRRNGGKLPALLAAGKPFPSNTVRAKALPPPRRSAGLPARRFRRPHHRTRTLHDSTKIIQYPSDRFSEMDIFRKRRKFQGDFPKNTLFFHTSTENFAPFSENCPEISSFFRFSHFLHKSSIRGDIAQNSTKLP
jgi:hypothetical protein